MPRKKKSIPVTSLPAKGFNKSAFIREHADKTPKEIAALATEAGHTIGVPFVYAVRAQDKARKGKPRGKPGPKPKSARNESDHKKTLRSLCFLIGFESVQKLLDQVFVEIGS